MRDVRTTIMALRIRTVESFFTEETPTFGAGFVFEENIRPEILAMEASKRELRS